MPEISVIVPIYKSEMFIRRCVESIISQKFSDFELILVDDGSTDKSGSICDEYAIKDPRIHVIHKTNGGVSSARNKGIEVAVGNWITFVDSDDYVLDTYLQDLFDPYYDLNVIGHQHIDYDKKKSEEKKLFQFSINVLDNNSMSSVIDKNGKYWMIFCWGRLFKKEILERYKIRFDEKLKVGEDYVFSSLYLSHCSSLRISDATSYIHVAHSVGTLSKTFDVNFFENILSSEEIAAGVLEETYQIQSFRKSEDDIISIFTSSLCSISSDDSLAFAQKYRSLKYLYHNKYFIKGLRNMDHFFAGTSKMFKIVLKIRSPMLTLVALMVAQKKGRHRH